MWHHSAGRRGTRGRSSRHGTESLAGMRPQFCQKPARFPLLDGSLMFDVAAPTLALLKSTLKTDMLLPRGREVLAQDARLTDLLHHLESTRNEAKSHR